MDSRPLLNKLKKVGVVIDSKSFEESLDNNDRTASALLCYSNLDCVTYIRSPFSSKHDELIAIHEYDLIIPEQISDKQPISGSIVYGIGNSKTRKTFNYLPAQIERLAKKILKIRSVNSDEFDSISLVYILSILNRRFYLNGVRDEVFILITHNEILLKKRLLIESNFSSVQLNIMSIEEASFFLDFFFKKNGKYLVGGNDSLDKGGWYWHSLRLKIPHFHSGEDCIDALACRMKYALMALDEMGIQYYQGVDNNTADNTKYHFNYLISLITGIFDNLAIKTDKSLKLGVQKEHITLSQRSDNGKKFLIQIKAKDQDLGKLIENSYNLIKLVYLFRDKVIHREGFTPLSSLDITKNGEVWNANFIMIKPDLYSAIHCCYKDKKGEYNSISKCGIRKEGNDVFLEPYHFSLEVLKKLIPFVDKYLELLHYSSFIEEQKQINNGFYGMIKSFEESHLGF